MRNVTYTVDTTTSSLQIEGVEPGTRFVRATATIAGRIAQAIQAIDAKIERLHGPEIAIAYAELGAAEALLELAR